MFYFTRQEKLCLTAFFLIVFFGLFLQVALKKYPHLTNIVNVIDNESFYPKVDVNQVDEETLKQIPGIGAYTAKAIIEYRNKHGRITDIDDLQNISGVYPKNFLRFKPYLKVKI